MKIIIGLGNPSKEYEQTHHNAGFTFLNYLTKSWKGKEWRFQKKLQAKISKNPDFTLIKPPTSMNRSGESVSSIFDYYDFVFNKAIFSVRSSEKDASPVVATSSVPPATPLEQSSHVPPMPRDLTIVFDDLDLPIGKWKLQKSKGPHGHNGLESIYSHLGTKNFWHLRIGIDGRNGGRSIPPQKYVLSKFSLDERGELERVFAEIDAKLKSLE